MLVNLTPYKLKENDEVSCAAKQHGGVGDTSPLLLCILCGADLPPPQKKTNNLLCLVCNLYDCFCCLVG